MEIKVLASISWTVSTVNLTVLSMHLSFFVLNQCPFPRLKVMSPKPFLCRKVMSTEYIIQNFT